MHASDCALTGAARRRHPFTHTDTDAEKRNRTTAAALVSATRGLRASRLTSSSASVLSLPRCPQAWPGHADRRRTSTSLMPSLVSASVGCFVDSRQQVAPCIARWSGHSLLCSRLLHDPLVQVCERLHSPITCPIISGMFTGCCRQLHLPDTCVFSVFRFTAGNGARQHHVSRSTAPALSLQVHREITRLLSRS